MHLKAFRWVLGLMLVYGACSPAYKIKPTGKVQHRIAGDSLTGDRSVEQMIEPYRLRIDSAMNVKIADAAVDLSKGLPEGTLGNLICDALVDKVKKEGRPIDFCVLNNGGIRIPILYQGPVYVRTVFELMPFDNELVLLKLSGKSCAALFEQIRKAKGAPVAGVQLALHKESCEVLSIAGQSFSEAGEYWLLTSDYLANGGDEASMLTKPIERIDLKIKLRDALIQSFREKGLRNEKLNATLNGRIKQD